MSSVSVWPDWTVIFTVPEPLGTTALICVSLTKVTVGEAVVPKKTDKWPAAPEKFWPVMVIVLPGLALVAPDRTISFVARPHSQQFELVAGGQVGAFVDLLLHVLGHFASS